MNEAQKKKRNFRSSKVWKAFRHQKNVEQNGLDPITKKKLLKRANLHHMNLDESKYEDLSHPEQYVFLNSMTHDFMHWLFRYYVNDPDIIYRIKQFQDEMVRINKG